MDNKQPLTIKEIVDRLSNINKEDLSEREFFQEVLSVIEDIKDFDLTEENFEEFSLTLRKIGCIDYISWKEDKLKSGYPMPEKRIETGIKQGSLSIAEKFIDQFMHDYNRAKYASTKLTEGGEKSGWVQVWLRNSKKVLTGEKHNPDIELDMYENRKREQRELEALASQRGQLTKEIEEIEKQLEELRMKENELKGTLSAKQSQLKGLEEK